DRGRRDLGGWDHGGHVVVAPAVSLLGGEGQGKEEENGGLAHGAHTFEAR
ncbi:MAG: hypothetical protein RLZ97_14, partial [Verrucomicrobiota bacterium]